MSQGSPAPPPEVDRGLANERTALAWNRTALALGAIGGLGVRAGAEGHAPYLAYPLGAIVLAAAVSVLVYGAHAYRTNRVQLQEGRVLPHAEALRVMAFGTSAVAVIAFALALLS